jgi:uridylate kinase
MAVAYRKILLKLSGEALAGESRTGLDPEALKIVAKSVRDVVNLGLQVGIVVGGGNFWRGRSGGTMDRARADHIGMLATVMNSLALADALEAHDVTVRVQTAITMQQIAEPYIRNRAMRHMEKGRVVIFGCGTGNPFFSTDTAAALRAVEIDADIIFKATLVDGIYDSDPSLNPDAAFYKEITFSKILSDNLRVMDSTAASMCKDNGMPVLVFNMRDPQNIVRACLGEPIGTIVKEA